MGQQYNDLTSDEEQHFVQHGWLRVSGAIKQKYIDDWMSHLWTRLGWDQNDKSTWTEEYVKMPRHREVPVEEFCPEAWAKMYVARDRDNESSLKGFSCDIVGGEDKIDPVRDRYYGDQFHVNFGTAELVGSGLGSQAMQKVSHGQ